MNEIKTTSRHTPGPLAWQKFGNDWCLTGQYGMRPIVLSVGGPLRKPRALQLRDAARDLLVPFFPEHPDAKLIAAAPDLLEACKDQHDAIDWLMARLVELDKEFVPITSTVWPAVTKGCAAIALVQGELFR